MDRLPRLFALIDLLRRHRRPVTAARLAEALDVSVRTVYRDVRTLCGFGAPIDGEAGIGYLLRPGFFLPPLMFTEDELEALVLGARWVQRQGDPALAEAAGTALARVAAAAPQDLRDTLAETGLWAPAAPAATETLPVLPILRQAIRRQQRLTIVYVAEDGTVTRRVIWPIALAFFERSRMVAAWCELRSGFRHFRTDRIRMLVATGERYPGSRAALVRAWRQERGYRA